MRVTSFHSPPGCLEDTGGNILRPGIICGNARGVSKRSFDRESFASALLKKLNVCWYLEFCKQPGSDVHRSGSGAADRPEELQEFMIRRNGSDGVKTSLLMSHPCRYRGEKTTGVGVRTGGTAHPQSFLHLSLSFQRSR